MVQSQVLLIRYHKNLIRKHSFLADVKLHTHTYLSNGQGLIVHVLECWLGMSDLVVHILTIEIILYSDMTYTCVGYVVFHTTNDTTEETSISTNHLSDFFLRNS
jgi:hypothetical protein